MSDKKTLQKALAKEEALLSRLDTVREQALARLNVLKRELVAVEATCSEPQALFIPIERLKKKWLCSACCS